jgi:hypothetical protein
MTLRAISRPPIDARPDQGHGPGLLRLTELILWYNETALKIPSVIFQS